MIFAQKTPYHHESTYTNEKLKQRTWATMRKKTCICLFLLFIWINLFNDKQLDIWKNADQTTDVSILSTTKTFPFTGAEHEQKPLHCQLSKTQKKKRRKNNQNRIFKGKLKIKEQHAKKDAKFTNSSIQVKFVAQHQHRNFYLLQLFAAAGWTADICTSKYSISNHMK